MSMRCRGNPQTFDRLVPATARPAIQPVVELGAGVPDRAGEGAVSSAVELYWIPLGAGTPVVQASGRLFERLSARRHHRPPCDLYHAALLVRTPQGRFAIEQAPVPDHNGASRGVVAEGPVGLRIAGRLRVFRYEVRCWPDGTIPDVDFAVDSPRQVSHDPNVADRILEQLPRVPTPVWGRDEAGAGEMWNSNSIMSWVLTRSGIDTDLLDPPSGGRAPGWGAGRVVALRAEREGSGRALDVSGPRVEGV